jgi:transcriptional regulator with XRE-family HTH domain
MLYFERGEGNLEKKAGRMYDLADFLTEKLGQSSYRDLEAKLKVSRGALENIIKRTNKQPPRLTTVKKIADYYKEPFWRIALLAGVDIGLEHSMEEEVKLLISLVERNPEYHPLVSRLLRLRPGDLRVINATLKALDELDEQDDAGTGLAQ